MIFDTPPIAELMRPRSDLAPLRRAEKLIARFSATFPQISYDIFWDTDTCNAQAFVAAEDRVVRLYGGLNRHRFVGIAGLAFALGHETGHHLGGAPLHPQLGLISSEGRADEWAKETGLPAVFGVKTARRYSLVGCAEIDRVRATLSSQ